ncbi:MAG: ComF family protein [Acidobacteria bacterium]|nr:ComF family protein [Acidobacteriota bacterium]MBK8810084.1 ComF family protein [Acidobacteriota bacterium]
MLHRIYDALLAVAFPQACSVCGNINENYADGVACDACWRKTRVFSGNVTVCGKCSQFLRPESPTGEAFCHRCADHSYDAAMAIGLYEKALASSVLSLKSEPFVARRLCEMLCAAFDRTPFYDSDLVVPIPLSRKRRIERGFNQAEILADIIVKHTGIRLDVASLARVRHTPMHRAAMDSRARELTVERAFAVTRPKLIEGRAILLIDDVFTSGATVSTCAKALKQNGARKVNVLTIARAI